MAVNLLAEPQSGRNLLEKPKAVPTPPAGRNLLSSLAEAAAMPQRVDTPKQTFSFEDVAPPPPLVPTPNWPQQKKTFSISPQSGGGVKVESSVPKLRQDVAEYQAAKDAEFTGTPAMKAGTLGEVQIPEPLPTKEQSDAALETWLDKNSDRIAATTDGWYPGKEDLLARAEDQRASATERATRIRMLRTNMPKTQGMSDEQVLSTFAQKPVDDPAAAELERKIQAELGYKDFDPSRRPLDRSTMSEVGAALGRGVKQVGSFVETGQRLVAQAAAPSGGAQMAAEDVARRFPDNPNLRASSNLNTLQTILVGSVESIPQLAAQVGATILTGGSSLAFVGTAILPVMSQSYNDTFDMVMANGGTIEDANSTALPKALADGLITGLTNKVEYNFLAKNAAAQNVIKRHVLIRLAAKGAAGGGAESIQESTDQIGQEITEAIARAKNNIEGKPFEESLNIVLMAGASAFLPGAALGVSMPPRAMKLQDLAAKAERDGNPQAAETLRAMAAGEFKQATEQDKQEALAAITAQVDKVISDGDNYAVQQEQVKEAEDVAQKEHDAQSKEYEKAAKEREAQMDADFKKQQADQRKRERDE